ncbi:MAG: GntR family transcriptional regulator [Blastocatellia bacterium]|nr:GntR family transcriptional regulator [Blastocatellia bacterium]
MREMGLKIKARTLRDEIIEALQRAIILGERKPGEPLVERELAEQFGVSSIPVREALQELENRGLATKRPNYSCCVIELTREELDQMFELRALLEPQVMAWAAERMTAEEAEELQPMLKELQRAAARKDFAQYFFHDLRLHRRIWELSRNRIAAQALERAVLPLFAFGLMRDHRAEELDLMQEVEKHQRMITALGNGNGKQAAEAIGRIAAGFESHVRVDAERPTRLKAMKKSLRK